MVPSYGDCCREVSITNCWFQTVTLILMSDTLTQPVFLSFFPGLTVYVRSGLHLMGFGTVSLRIWLEWLVAMLTFQQVASFLKYSGRAKMRKLVATWLKWDLSSHWNGEGSPMLLPSRVAKGPVHSLWSATLPWTLFWPLLLSLRHQQRHRQPAVSPSSASSLRVCYPVASQWSVKFT